MRPRGPEFATYCVDEPSREVLLERAVPRYQEIKKAFPKLRVYMASEPWPEVGQACDFFMTDLSSHLYARAQAGGAGG